MQAAIKGQMALPAMCTATLHFDTVPVEVSDCRSRRW